MQKSPFFVWCLGKVFVFTMIALPVSHERNDKGVKHSLKQKQLRWERHPRDTILSKSIWICITFCIIASQSLEEEAVWPWLVSSDAVDISIWRDICLLRCNSLSVGPVDLLMTVAHRLHCWWRWNWSGGCEHAHLAEAFSVRKGVLSSHNVCFPSKFWWLKKKEEDLKRSLHSFAICISIT